MPLEARDSFPSAADFVRLVSEVIDDLPATGPDQPLYLDQLKIDLPFEIEVSAADPDAGPGAALTVAMSPPTQTFETGVMPVWHRMRMTISAEPQKTTRPESQGDG